MRAAGGSDACGRSARPPSDPPAEITLNGTGASAERRSLLIDEASLADWFRDGMCVALGGLATACHAMIGVRHIIRRGLRKLTVVGSAVGGLDVDLLIGAGCVRKVISPYVGAEALASIGPFYRAAAERTALLAHGVVRAPFGAHPFSSPGFYLEDRPHIALLVEAGRAYARNGDRGPFERYLDRYVRTPADHVEYLEAVGLRRLLALGEY